jgi:hypothetical protein
MRTAIGPDALWVSKVQIIFSDAEGEFRQAAASQ